MISVIVPVYKVEPYLRQCIDSIINQTCRDLEIILVDDASPDQCGAICDEYAAKDSRIRVFHLPENKGLSAARNIGLDNAKGDYIGFVDSDDWIEPDMYEVLLKQVSEADIVECRTANKNQIYNTKEALKALLKGNINDVVWDKLYRAEMLKDIRFPEGRNFEDVAVMHKVIAGAGTVIILNNGPQYHHMERVDSISEDHTAKNLLDYADAYLQRYRFYCETKSYLETDLILRSAATGISKVWRWWACCEAGDKRRYENRIDELTRFNREHIPLLGCASWPMFLRVSALFMRSKSRLAFRIVYGLNQLCRMFR